MKNLGRSIQGTQITAMMINTLFIATYPFAPSFTNGYSSPRLPKSIARFIINV